MKEKNKRSAPVDSGIFSTQLDSLLARIIDAGDRYLACGRGWYKVLAELEERISIADPNCKLYRIGELDGRLLIEVADVSLIGSQAVRAAVTAAERRAGRTCEFSGEHGILMQRNGMFRVLNPATAPEGYQVVIKKELCVEGKHLLAIIENLVQCKIK